MDNQTFNKEKRQLNKAYFDVFGEVPLYVHEKNISKH